MHGAELLERGVVLHRTVFSTSSVKCMEGGLCSTVRTVSQRFAGTWYGSPLYRTGMVVEVGA